MASKTAVRNHSVCSTDVPQLPTPYEPPDGAPTTTQGGATGRLHQGLNRLAELVRVDRKSAFLAARNLLGEWMPVAAYYVALVDPDCQRMVFEVAADDAAEGAGPSVDVEGGAMVPIDDGPTSRVVRTGTYLLLQGDTQPVALTPASTFGNHQRRTPSQLHVPMRPYTASADQPPLGVLSVQSYTANAYRPEHVALVRVVADHLATLVQGQQSTDVLTQEALDLRRQLKAQQTAMRDQTRLLTEVFFHFQREFTRRFPSEAETAPEVAEFLRTGIDRLREAVQQGVSGETAVPAVLAGQLGSSALGSEDDVDNPEALPAKKPSSVSLTEREVEVLALFPRANVDIAELLQIEVSTVRYHSKNIYRKLGVRNKAEAMEWSTRLER